MRDRDREPDRTVDRPADRGAVLLLNADRGQGPEVARALAAAGLAVVLQSTGSSAATGDVLHEIVTSGGRAAAVECHATDNPSAEDVLAALAATVGRVTAAVVNPWQALNTEVTPRRSPIGLPPSEVDAAEQACRWCRSVVDSLPHPAAATIVGLSPGQPPSSVREAVPRALWQGLLQGLRRELAPRGVHVFSLTVAASDDTTRTLRDPRAAAAHIAELLRPAPPSAPDASARTRARLETLQKPGAQSTPRPASAVAR